MRHIKQLIKKIIKILVNFLFKLDNNLSVGNIFFSLLHDKVKKISYNNIDLTFYTPNKLINYRVKTFKSKEPEILRWINDFKNDSVFFDVGANIGLYSCYASKKKDCKTFSFEPSVFNLENLAKNIHINDLSNKVTIIPNPLYKNKIISKMKMSSTNIGGAISTFAEDYTFDGSKIDTVFSYNLPGISLDELISEFSLPAPDYLKIDVDGIEHLILQGAMKNLKNLKSIFIEVSDNFTKQKNEVDHILKSNDFIFDSKYSDQSIKTEKFKDCYNQIWFKKS